MATYRSFADERVYRIAGTSVEEIDLLIEDGAEIENLKETPRAARQMAAMWQPTNLRPEDVQDSREITLREVEELVADYWSEIPAE